MQLPQDTLLPMKDQVNQMLTQQQQALTDQFAAVGATDDSPIPAEVRETMVSAIKLSRDQLKQAMETVRQQAQAVLDATP